MAAGGVREVEIALVGLEVDLISKIEARTRRRERGFGELRSRRKRTKRGRRRERTADGDDKAIESYCVCRTVIVVHCVYDDDNVEQLKETLTVHTHLWPSPRSIDFQQHLIAAAAGHHSWFGTCPDVGEIELS